MTGSVETPSSGAPPGPEHPDKDATERPRRSAERKRRRTEPGRWPNGSEPRTTGEVPEQVTAMSPEPTSIASPAIHVERAVRYPSASVRTYGHRRRAASHVHPV